MGDDYTVTGTEPYSTSSTDMINFPCMLSDNCTQQPNVLQHHHARVDFDDDNDGGSTELDDDAITPLNFHRHHHHNRHVTALGQYQLWPVTSTTTPASTTTTTELFTTTPMPFSATTLMSQVWSATIASAAAAAARRRLVSNPLAVTSAARLSALEARWLASTTLPSVAAAVASSPALQRLSNSAVTATTAMMTDEQQLLMGDNTSINFVGLSRDPSFVTILVMLYVIEFIIGFLGNLFVVIVITRQVNMHNVTNFFIANMAVADMLLAMLSLPLTPHFTLTGEWVFGRFFCHVMPFVQGTAFFACTITLMIIALDRWRNVCQPLQPRMTNSICKTCIILTWVASALVCLPYGIFMKVEHPNNEPSAGGGMCVENWPVELGANARLTFGTIVIAVQYFIPLMVISVCYILIWARLKQRPRFASASGERERRELQRQSRLQYMLSLMVIFFAISWLPLNATNLTFDFYAPLHTWPHANALFLVCHVIAMSSVCYNPILYAGLNETFRAGLRKLLGFEPASPNTSIGSGTQVGGGGGRGRGGGDARGSRSIVIGGASASQVPPPSGVMADYSSSVTLTMRHNSFRTINNNNNTNTNSGTSTPVTPGSAPTSPPPPPASPSPLTLDHTNTNKALLNKNNNHNDYKATISSYARLKSAAAAAAVGDDSDGTNSPLLGRVEQQQQQLTPGTAARSLSQQNLLKQNNTTKVVDSGKAASPAATVSTRKKRILLQEQKKISNFSTTTNTTLLSLAVATPPLNERTTKKPSFNIQQQHHQQQKQPNTSSSSTNTYTSTSSAATSTNQHNQTEHIRLLPLHRESVNNNDEQFHDNGDDDAHDHDVDNNNNVGQQEFIRNNSHSSGGGGKLHLTASVSQPANLFQRHTAIATTAVVLVKQPSSSNHQQEQAEAVTMLSQQYGAADKRLVMKRKGVSSNCLKESFTSHDKSLVGCPICRVMNTFIRIRK